MAAVFETWTVLPHEPIEKLSDNLWRVQGTLPNRSARRVMTLARMADGRIVIHSAIALEEAAMAEIEAWGTPAIIAVPNGMHRLDARVYKQRYASAKVLCPSGARKRVEKVVPVDGSFDDAPTDDSVRLSHLEGCAGREGLLEVRDDHGTTVVFTDAMNNMPKTSGLMGFFLGPTGRPSVPRLAQWIVARDKRALHVHMTRIAERPDLRRVIVSHGTMITDSPGEAIRRATETL